MRKLLAMVMLAAVAAAGCGASKAPAAVSPTTAAGFPVTVAGVTVPARPTRILSLSATATEMLFAIGAGNQVFAADKYSTYPPNAPHTDLDGFHIDAEAIASKKPDLVVVSEDTGNKLLAGLATLKIPAVNLPAASSIDESYRQIEELGTLTGHLATAKTEVGHIRSQLDAIVRAAGGRAKGLTYFHELDDTLYSETSHTFIGELYGLLGMVNIADAAGTGNDYPQLSAEYVIKSNPSFVFLADTICCHQTAATFGARPGFNRLKAVHDNHVVMLPDDIASHWGPRIVDFLRAVANATTNQGTSSG